jgi:hypothetical protein
LRCVQIVGVYDKKSAFAFLCVFVLHRHKGYFTVNASRSVSSGLVKPVVKECATWWVV